ncbi:MAG TPA: trypsin-like peptidase domain-containing protein [Aggregatilinea sp.]|uniref:S1C family serine protease n=1 Tax=Aggregatilinea sp. TaxID=2806333 RepID=UPI002C3D61B9|nr:trypsin-like peptidase domain-containing protein [Aggregatilinea sp.]HML24782.1 trypsin-like peptidase domain-containing protein [Aggregatilinea sp.]
MDDFNWNVPEPDDHDEPGGRLTGLLVGLGMGVVTLVLIAALVGTMVGYLFSPRSAVTRSSSPSLQRTAYQPSETELRNANYRPGDLPSAAQQMATPTAVSGDIVAAADEEYLLLTNIYERVNPSVVNIEIVSSFHSDSGIVDSSGSGFVYDSAGHIVTNSHVVRDAEEILVTFSDGYVANATVVGVDDYSDLAVIQIESGSAPLWPVPLGDSNTLKVGQRVIAIGNPFGLEGSMTTGIVSALGRSLPSAQLLDASYERYDNPSIIQVDAAVNPGNSGGPLLNSSGEVIGINTAIRTESGSFEGVAFAVPVNTLKRIVPQIIDGGQVRYSWLGIVTSSSNLPGISMAVLADELNLAVSYGVMIDSVQSSSPAERAGLQGSTDTRTVRGVEVAIGGDIVVAINGAIVRDIDDLVAYLVENTSPGDTVVLTIVRGEQTLDVNVTLGERPATSLVTSPD